MKLHSFSVLGVLTSLCISLVLLSAATPSYSQQKAVRFVPTDKNGLPLDASDKGKPTAEDWNGKITGVNLSSYIFQLQGDNKQTITVALSLATEMLRVEGNLKVSQLKVGDTVSFERGFVSGVPQEDYKITAVNPLTLQFDGDPYFLKFSDSSDSSVTVPFTEVQRGPDASVGTMSLKAKKVITGVTLIVDENRSDALLYRRYTNLHISDLSKGQSVFVAMAKYPDGKYEADKVYVGIKMPLFDPRSIK